MTLVLCVILFGLFFEYINGFHDTANAIATVVSTRVLSPRQAVAMAACCNLVGSLLGVAVATTIGNGMVKSEAVTRHALLCAILAAIAWNLFTWWLGLPSSSSHALIGGLCGATLAAASGDLSVISWSTHSAEGGWEGLLPKVVLPMFISPLLGLLIGFMVMGLLLVVLRNWRPHQVNTVFGRLQLVSASFMGLRHGTNDAQKTMGLIALTLWTATQDGLFEGLPRWMQFLDTPQFEVHIWVKLVCSVTMAAGTAAGGWRIIRTLGHRMVKLQPIHGFAAETTAASVICAASLWGIPISTTHVISSSIMGVGATRRFNAVKWTVVGRMIWAWLLTLPATALLSYLLERSLGFM
jgi:inorganic phosphate transporter, PiT family